MKKRLIAILLILSLVLTVFPMAAFAEEPACKHEHTAPYSESFGNTRGEFFLMLWKMYGCPEPRIEDKFEDVSEADVFYKAVLWATQNNISNGLTDTQFRPEQATTRAQAVTFLWRAAGCPEPENPYTTFRDLKSGAFYEKAVAWAAEQDWLELRTDGVSFRPDYSAGEFLLEGTVCEDCGTILETQKLTFSEAGPASSTKGRCGDDLTWEYSDGVLTITGSGEMTDLMIETENAPWVRVRDHIEEVSLPEGLTSIGSGMFAECDALTSVTIPEGVERIGEEAFYGCDNLSYLSLPDSVTTIDEAAFCDCYNLGSVTIPKGVKQISDETFMGCSNLGTAVIPEGVERIGNQAFSECFALVNVNIPKSVTSVGRYAFRSSGLESDPSTWPGGILYVDDWAIDEYEFYDDPQIRPGTRGIAASAFTNRDNLRKVSIPGSVEFIGDWAFESCYFLTEVTIPEGLTTIGIGAFYECSVLRHVELPKSVTAIGRYAFEQCRSLSRITITNKECFIEEGEVLPEYTAGDPALTTIYGYKDSTAETYANKYGYRFAALSEKVPFIDVAVNAFYSDPVAWAVENKITNGVDDIHFGPDKGCTRGQVVTFLWRAAGCPEPKSTETGFKDMKPGAFYEKAVAWAVEEGITNGLSKDKFGPDATCTRGQIVTFLYRAAGRQGQIYDCLPFGDVRPEDYFFPAVGWAVANGVTNGMTENTFGPNKICTRGQVVTFLYRATQD